MISPSNLRPRLALISYLYSTDINTNTSLAATSSLFPLQTFSSSLTPAANHGERRFKIV